MSDKPCPCCGHDSVAVEMVIGEELEENQALKAKVAALEAKLTAAESRLKDIALEIANTQG